MVNITTLDKTGEDERGYTVEYGHERQGQHLMLYRRAGSVSGRHYHKGLSATKDPEILLLLSGSLRLNWKLLPNGDATGQLVEGPARIEIPAFYWHELLAETDCCMLELNALAEHAADTFYLEE